MEEFIIETNVSVKKITKGRAFRYALPFLFPVLITFVIYMFFPGFLTVAFLALSLIGFAYTCFGIVERYKMPEIPEHKIQLLKFDDYGVHLYSITSKSHKTYSWFELEGMEEMEDSDRSMVHESCKLYLQPKKGKEIDITHLIDGYSTTEIMQMFYDRLYYYNKEK